MMRQKPPAGLVDAIHSDTPAASDTASGRGRADLEQSGKSGQAGARPAPGVAMPNQQDTADYVRDISRQLAGLSTSAGLDMLAYLLDMVCVEAELVKARQGERPKG